MEVALVSLNPKWKDKQTNFKVCEKIFEELQDLHVNLVVFPESTLTGFAFSDAFQAEALRESKTLQFFVEKAKKFHTAVMFGMFIKSEIEDSISNSAVLLDCRGVIKGLYSKLHLFSPGYEDEYISKGKDLVNAELEGEKIGMSICYDLRFPGMFRQYRNNSRIIINIANWPSQRSIHWDTLLRARAIENQTYFVGVNRSGSDPEGIFYGGDSMIYSPQGDLVRARYRSEMIAVYSLNLGLVNESRSMFKVLNDDRFQYISSDVTDLDL